MKNLNYILILVVLFSILASCKKDITNPTYYYSGVLYNKDGVTPMANEQLTLKGSSNSPFNYKTGTVGSLTTNSNGSFKFEFGENEYTHFSVISPKGGLLLTHGNTDRNFTRDVCIERKALVTLIVNIEKILGVNDTLFFAGPPLQTELKRVPPRSGTATVSVYPNISGSFVLDKVNYPWNGEGVEFKGFIWSIGWNDFLKIYEPDVDLTYFKEHRVDYEIRGFPYVDTVKVTIR